MLVFAISTTGKMHTTQYKYMPLLAILTSANIAAVRNA